LSQVEQRNLSWKSTKSGEGGGGEALEELSRLLKLRRFRVVEAEESLSDVSSEIGWTWDGSPEDSALYCGLRLLGLGAAGMEFPGELAFTELRRARHMVRMVSEMIEDLAGGIED